jgi:hypothetical protein
VTLPYPDLATARAVYDAFRAAGHRVAIDPPTCTVIVEKAKQ